MEEKSPINILFCGVGGQGVLTASELVGWAALVAGYHVKKSEVHGMAQRGGSVESHLRFGSEVFSPLIPLAEADFLVPLHRGEGERMAFFLKPAGTNLASYLDVYEGQKGSGRGLNVFMAGVLSGCLTIPEDAWSQGLSKVFRDKHLSENRTLFDLGRRLASDGPHAGPGGAER